ncbi:hypothetical protein, partial [Escherichia coli]|uniref:hypothetical protein n=1 Tax=Escherichia coli TaxID=562 RepID=UPI00211A15EE
PIFACTNILCIFLDCVLIRNGALPFSLIMCELIELLVMVHLPIKGINWFWLNMLINILEFATSMLPMNTRVEHFFGIVF